MPQYHVPELRQFIQAVFPQPGTKPSYAWIVAELEKGPFTFIEPHVLVLDLIRIRYHSAELIKWKAASLLSDSCRAIDHGTVRIDFDGNRNGRKHRQEQDGRS